MIRPIKRQFLVDDPVLINSFQIDPNVQDYSFKRFRNQKPGNSRFPSAQGYIDVEFGVKDQVGLINYIRVEIEFHSRKYQCLHIFRANLKNFHMRDNQLRCILHQLQ